MILDKVKIVLRSRRPILNLDQKTILFVSKCGYCLRDEYCSTGMMKCRYNYVFEKDEGTIFIGCGLNSFKDCGNSLKKWIIEYNPQKIVIPLYLQMFFISHGFKVDSVLSCDVAFDLPGIPLSSININTCHPIMYVGVQSNLTRYINYKSNHLRIKIYDKSKERQRLGFKIGLTSRIEITLRNPKFYENVFMDKDDYLYLTQVKQSLQDISINRVPKKEEGKDYILYMLSHMTDEQKNHAYHMMSSKLAARYRKYFKDEQGEPFTISIDELHKSLSYQINQCIVDVLGGKK